MPIEDKKIESLNALKNANKHLSDVFSALAKKDQVLSSCSADLQFIAKQCGDINVKVWIGSSSQFVELRAFLNTVANRLSEVRD